MTDAFDEPEGPRQALLLLRHAKSSWPDGVDDHDRPLAHRGVRSAALVGQFLARNGLVPDRVLCSTARRAVDTCAGVLAAAVGAVPGVVAPPVGYDGRVYDDDVLGPAAEALAELPPAGRLLVVGHEPGLVRAVHRLCGAEVRLPTAGLVWLEPAGRPGAARLRLLVPPRLLDGFVDTAD